MRGQLGPFAAREIKEAAELAVRISSAGFQFDRGRRRYLLCIAGISVLASNDAKASSRRRSTAGRTAAALALREDSTYRLRVSLQLLTDRWIGVDNGRMIARWRLTVEESFSIRGRGTVVVGTLSGTGQNEAALVTTPSGQNFHVAHVVFDVPRQSRRGEIRFGVLLGAVDHKQLTPGTIVQPIDA